MDDNPRQFSADSLDGSENPTGRASHREDPETFEPDDTENEPTGKVQSHFSEAPQPETAGDVSTKVVSAPEQPVVVSDTQAETA